LEAIAARAAFDAVNAIDQFSPRGYHYETRTTGSAPAAAAVAVHDVLLAQLPDATVDARWTQVRTWLDGALASTLGGLGVAADDGGVVAGHAAAAAAVAARTLDGASPVTTYG